jgi:drug/metabolite transporter (DMT)-like permease
VPTAKQSELTTSVIVFLSAAVWGLYWLPLRRIDEAGVTAGWSVLAIYVVPFAFLLPFTTLRWRSMRAQGLPIILIGLPIGAALVLYATSFLYTTVLRATLLFYMTPIWATLLAMLILKERSGLRRWFAIIVGLVGLTLMLSGKSAQASSTAINWGDVSALIAGWLWALGTVLIRKTPDLDSLDLIPCQYVAAILFSAVLVATSHLTGTGAELPPLPAWIDALPWLIGFYVVVFLPSLYACIWGAQILSPGRIGILMMSEVLVAGISAPLLAGEIISVTEWFATALIVLAAVMEITTAPKPEDDQGQSSQQDR